MKIERINDNLVLTVPLKQSSFDAIGEYVGDVPNLVGFSDGQNFSINYLIDLGYKDDIQLGMEFIHFEDFEELKKACEILGLSIWEYDKCAKCGKTLYGSFTLNKKLEHVCLYTCDKDE